MDSVNNSRIIHIQRESSVSKKIANEFEDTPDEKQAIWNQSFNMQPVSMEEQKEPVYSAFVLDQKLGVVKEQSEFENPNQKSESKFSNKDEPHSPKSVSNTQTLSFANQDYYAKGFGPCRNSKAGKKSNHHQSQSNGIYTNGDLTYNDNENLDEFSQVESSTEFGDSKHFVSKNFRSVQHQVSKSSQKQWSEPDVPHEHSATSSCDELT